jgi:hypothetical protein
VLWVVIACGAGDLPLNPFNDSPLQRANSDFLALAVREQELFPDCILRCISMICDVSGEDNAVVATCWICCSNSGGQSWQFSYDGVSLVAKMEIA